LDDETTCFPIPNIDIEVKALVWPLRTRGFKPSEARYTLNERSELAVRITYMASALYDRFRVSAKTHFTAWKPLGVDDIPHMALQFDLFVDPGVGSTGHGDAVSVWTADHHFVGSRRMRYGIDM
jgi:hypothetical protein